MGAKIVGFLATLMLSIPLAAIGLMAVFGIPQLVPANGDSSGPREKVIRGMQDALSWAGGTNTQPSHKNPADSDDAPAFEKSSHEHHPAHDDEYPLHEQTEGRITDGATSSGIFGVSSQRDFDELPAAARSASSSSASSSRSWDDTRRIGNDRRDQLAAVTALPHAMPDRMQGGRSQETQVPAASRRRQSGLDRQTPLLTWRQASLRLTELGVRNYHLERGAGSGTFLFVCTFSPGDAPHVVHRFEAEMDDPLLAVNEVLQQVDHWMQSRYAATNFPSKPQSLSLGSQ